MIMNPLHDLHTHSPQLISQIRDLRLDFVLGLGEAMTSLRSFSFSRRTTTASFARNTRFSLAARNCRHTTLTPVDGKVVWIIAERD